MQDTACEAHHGRGNIFRTRILRVAPTYARYQKATNRTIPLVRLVPVGQAGERTMPGGEILHGQEELSFTK